ncbi:MAG TPA: short-chain dehydrogenase/reductase, partial [Mycobacterium sp.]|nr:short-chain dehydrogenase/reductase [Mycobacterium sp.]
EKFAKGLAKALDSSKPFVKTAIGPDARMLLFANRLLPSAGLHQMTRLMMGIPRFGALRSESGNDG